jgi:hypothetical protein
VSAGLSTYIILDRQSNEQLGHPYSDCIQESSTYHQSEILQKMFMLNKTYIQSDCRVMCFQKFLGDHCKCQMYSNKFFPDMITCLSYDEIGCLIESSIDFVQRDLINMFCDCPEECRHTFYMYDSSFVQFPSLYYSEFLAKTKFIKSKFPNKTKITYDDLKSRMVSINVWYDELKETFVTQEERMGFIDLVNAIGGIFGLFLGASFFSFIEFIEISLKVLIRKCRKKRVEHYF